MSQSSKSENATHQHGHQHAHTHNHADNSNEKALRIAFLIIFVFMIVETVGGIVSGSLALLADAGHMFTDAAALAMAWGAFVAARRPPDREHSYGHKRYQVIAAFVNGILLLFIVVLIVKEAVERFVEPHQVDAPMMLLIASIGFVVNVVTFWMLHSGEKDNLNIRGAMLHVLSDLLGSVVAIIAGLAIYFYQWMWMDPLLSLLVAALIVRSGVYLVKDALHILLEGVPKHLDIESIKHQLAQLDENIESIHHVHTWSLNEEEVLMSLHVNVKSFDGYDSLLKRLHQHLHELGIQHATVQIENNYCSSRLEQD